MALLCFGNSTLLLLLLLWLLYDVCDCSLPLEYLNRFHRWFNMYMHLYICIYIYMCIFVLYCTLKTVGANWSNIFGVVVLLLVPLLLPLMLTFRLKTGTVAMCGVLWFAGRSCNTVNWNDILQCLRYRSYNGYCCYYYCSCNCCHCSYCYTSYGICNCGCCCTCYCYCIVAHYWW